MKNNCGVIAFDELVGGLNGRTNNISLDTLSKMAQDNGFLLYPMKVKKDQLNELFPVIAHFRHHFEKWEDETAIDPDINGDSFYVLSPVLIPEFVVPEAEAKLIKGSRGHQWYDVAGDNPLGMGKVGAGIVDAGLGMIPGVGPVLSAGMGALQGTNRGGGLQGALLGGLGGYGAGSIGAGLGSLAGGGTFMGSAANGTGFSGFGFNPQIGGFLNSVGSGVGNALSPITSMFGGGAPAAGGGYAANAGNMATSMGNYGIGTGTGTGSAMASSGARLAGGGSGGLSLGNLFGGGLLASSMLPKTPQFALPSSVSDYAKTVKSGSVTPLGAESNAKLSQVINEPLGTTFGTDNTSANNPYIAAISAQYDTALQQDLKTLAQQYATYGSPYSGELTDAQGKLIQQYAQSKQTAITGLQTQMESQDVQTKLTAISTASGIDQNALNDLAGVTNMDVAAAAANYQVDANTVNQLRQLLGTGGIISLLGSAGAFKGATG